MWVLSRAHLYTEVYPKLYWGLGRIKESYKIRLRENAVPYAVSAPRRAPLPLQKKSKNGVKTPGRLGCDPSGEDTD